MERQVATHSLVYNLLNKILTVNLHDFHAIEPIVVVAQDYIQSVVCLGVIFIGLDELRKSIQGDWPLSAPPSFTGDVKPRNILREPT